MTCADLIAELQKHPADLRVLVDGYEGGLTDPKALTVECGLLTVSEPSYFGRYGLPDDLFDDPDPNAPPFDALVIPR